MRAFFLKHVKIIMTLISVMLMFAFSMLGPKSQNASDRAKAPVGYLDGTKITNDQVAGALAEIDLLRTFGLLPPNGNDGLSWLERDCGDQSQLGIYWILLCADAARYNAVNLSPEEAVRTVVSVGARRDPDFDESAVDVILRSHNTNRPMLALILSRLEMAFMYAGSSESFLTNMPKPMAAVELSADRLLRQAKVEYVPVNVLQGWDKLAPPSNEQITALFEAYKNVLPTPVLSAPNDPPVFLGIEVDNKGNYALLGYPGAADAALHVYAGDTIPWDGSKVEGVFHQSEIGLLANRLFQAQFDTLALSGGGRAAITLVPPGLDLHLHLPPPVPAAVNDRHFPFGYKFPDRVKVEYIKLDRAAIRTRLKVTEDDVASAFRAFQADPYKFRDNPDAVPAMAPATSVSVAAPTESQPATQTKPAPRTPDQIRADWDDPKVKLSYINEQLDLRAGKIIKSMLDYARHQADAPWLTGDSPDRANWVDYRGIVRYLNLKAPYQGYSRRAPALRQWLGLARSPAVLGTTGNDFLRAADLQSIPGLGRAVFGPTSQGALFDFPVLAANIAELVPPDKTQAIGRLNLQLGHEGPEVTDQDGNVYLFRVTDFQKSHLPASINDEDTRARVIADCQKLAAFQARVRELKAALDKSRDLAALAQQEHSIVCTPREFNRYESDAPIDVRFIHNFVKTVFNLPEPPDYKTPSVTVLEDDALLRAYPMSLLRVLPATGADFAKKREDLYRQADPAIYTFTQDYLQFDQLSERVHYKPVADSSTKKPAATPAKKP